jgi:hypothetical protein
VREAMMLGYADDFRAMVLVTLIAIPLLLLLKPTPKYAAAPPQTAHE